MSLADLTGATAQIVTLQNKVDVGKNDSLVSGSPSGITSALRLHTRVNSFTHIRVWAGTQNSRPIGFLQKE
jgi:hypothetical protein